MPSPVLMPTAEIIPFPAARRIGKICRIAQLVDESTTKAGKAHWGRTVDDLTRQMMRAVIAELTRRSRGLSVFRPDRDAA